jgi:predicted ATPase
LLAGIGKTRLLTEVVRIADSFLLKTAFGSSDSTTRTTPFYSYREILLHLLDLKQKISSFGEKGTSELIRDKLQIHKLQEYASLLNDFLPFNFPENDLTTNMNQQVRTASIQEILLKIIRSQTEVNPVVIILDDVQWLDAASW